MYDNKEFDNLFLSALGVFRKEGMIIISKNSSFLYIDLKANEICQKFSNNSVKIFDLDVIVAEMVGKLIYVPNVVEEVILKDYQYSECHWLRIRAVGLPSNMTFINESIEEPWFVLFLEDMNERLDEELIVDQEKYGLTEKELEIHKLLLRSKTYKDIAETLCISLNTVKFHVKNINRKKCDYSNMKKIA
jgi:DNA-binding CsgD family transcriptional regulator